MRTKLILITGLVLAAGVIISATVLSFYDRMVSAINKGLNVRLSAVQRNSVAALTAAFEKHGDNDQRKLRYLIAAAWHESRLKPIREIKAKEGTEVWEKYQKNYWSTGYFGRGYVQITWQKNYEKLGKEIGVDLVSNPDLALVPENAAAIMVIGCMKGLFTGRKLSDYINETKNDFYNARRTIGAITVAGKDTAALIVDHYNRITNALNS